jgi:hypothetical protein
MTLQHLIRRLGLPPYFTSTAGPEICEWIGDEVTPTLAAVLDAIGRLMEAGVPEVCAVKSVSLCMPWIRDWSQKNPTDVMTLQLVDDNFLTVHGMHGLIDLGSLERVPQLPLEPATSLAINLRALRDRAVSWMASDKES